MRLLIIVLFITAGCGAEYYNKRSDDLLIDPDLLPFLDEFRADAALYNIPLEQPDVIVFREMDDTYTAGMCVVAKLFSITYRDIFIDPSYQYSPLLKPLMYHEFGHCLMNLEHTSDGIMQPYLQSSDYYKDDWDNLVESLFKSK